MDVYLFFNAIANHRRIFLCQPPEKCWNSHYERALRVKYVYKRRKLQQPTTVNLINLIYQLGKR